MSQLQHMTGKAISALCTVSLCLPKMKAASAACTASGQWPAWQWQWPAWQWPAWQQHQLAAPAVEMHAVAALPKGFSRPKPTASVLIAAGESYTSLSQCYFILCRCMPQPGCFPLAVHEQQTSQGGHRPLRTTCLGHTQWSNAAGSSAHGELWCQWLLLCTRQQKAFSSCW